MSPAESPLLRDYLRILTKLIPQAKIEPYIGPLINEAISKAIDDPEGAQEQLEAITSLYPLVETYQALMKFYRLRNVEPSKQLNTAEQFWGVTGITDDKLVWQIVRSNLVADSFLLKASGPTLDFLESVWKDAGCEDAELGVRLARMFSHSGQSPRGLLVLQQLLKKPESNKQVVVAYLVQLTRMQMHAAALETVDKYKSTMASDDEFLAAWADVLESVGESDLILSAFTSEHFSIDRLRLIRPELAITLLLRSGRRDEVDSLLEGSLLPALRRRSSRELARVGEMYAAAGRFSEFENVLRKNFSEAEAKEILAHISPRKRRFLRKGGFTENALFY